jgi:glutaminyl-peptide cyclotransferase
MRTARDFFILFFCATAIVACGPTPTPAPRVFDGAHAYQTYVMDQMKFGARHAGSAGARSLGDYIIADLKKSGATVVTQEFTFHNVPIRNVIGKLGEGRGPLIVIGAHYDTRPRADMDKVNPKASVPGANDGASGVAVLLELARTLNTSKLKNEIWLAFFDAEDNGDLDTCALGVSPCDNFVWPFAIGADYVAEHLTAKPEFVVILDMIGDSDQNIYYEGFSDVPLQETLWGIAAKLGYSKNFIPQMKWSMDDDHTPFLKRGIRAIDVIDFDYPYWHTTQDTADKVSGASLESVGRVLQTWLEGR